MSADEEFTAYMTVRWQPLVRSLVLLGCERFEAEDVVQAGLARCYASWARVTQADDVDACVFRTVLDGWRSERPGDVPPGPVADDLDDDELLVSAPPVAAVLAEGRRRRRSRRRTTVAVTGVVALLAAVASQFLGSVSDDPTVDRTENPVSVPWWSAGGLHLDHVVVPVPVLSDLVDPGPGVAYVDDRRRVVVVDDDGRSEVVGRDVVTHGLAADAERGWLFWLGADRTTVAYDVRSRREVGRALAPVSPFAYATRRVITSEDGTLYFDTRTGNLAWDVRAGTFLRLGTGASYLLDREDTFQVTLPPELGVGFVVTDRGTQLWRTTQPVVTGQLSPDGRWTVTNGPRGLNAFETGSGKAVPTPVPVSRTVRSFAFSPDGTFTAAVVAAGGGTELLSCEVGGSSCTAVRAPGTVRLAR